MKKINVLLYILMGIIFFTLVFLFFITYRSAEYSKEYYTHITDSTNQYIKQVDEVNTDINNINYKPGEERTSKLSFKLEEMEEIISSAYENEEAFNKKPYDSNKIRESYSNFLNAGDDLNSRLEDIIISIEKLEEKSSFDTRLEAYVLQAEKLNKEAINLKKELKSFNENYNKFDIQSVIYEIQNL